MYVSLISLECARNSLTTTRVNQPPCTTTIPTHRNLYDFTRRFGQGVLHQRTRYPYVLVR